MKDVENVLEKLGMESYLDKVTKGKTWMGETDDNEGNRSKEIH